MNGEMTLAIVLIAAAVVALAVRRQRAGIRPMARKRPRRRHHTEYLF